MSTQPYSPAVEEGATAIPPVADVVTQHEVALIEAVRTAFYRCQPLPVEIHDAVMAYERERSREKCPSVYPPSAIGPYSDERLWSGPLRCVLSAGHEGDRHWNTGINWRGGAS